MKWFDKIPGSKTLSAFQTLVIRLHSFHQEFAKDKFKNDFCNIADQLKLIKEKVIFTNKQPATDVVAGAANVINQLLLDINSLKHGRLKQQKFSQMYGELKECLTKLTESIQADLRILAEKEKEKESKGDMQKSLIAPFPESLLDEMIHDLRSVPYSFSYMNKIRTAFFRYPKSMTGASASLGIAVGASAQTLFNTALIAMGASLKQCSDGAPIDERVALPVTLAVASMAVVGRVLWIMRESKPAEVKDVKDDGYQLLKDPEDLEKGTMAATVAPPMSMTMS